MLFIHTADWHLGRLFLGVHLTSDQAHVLGQFIDLVRDAKPDVVLISGDVYDRAVPPPEAVALLDDILSRLILDVGTQVVLIAGNHDSSERLSFGSRLLRRQGLHVFGGLADLLGGHAGGGHASGGPLVLEDRHGPVEIWAIPYADPTVVREWATGQGRGEDGQAAGPRGDVEVAAIRDHDTAMRAVLNLALGGPPGAPDPPLGGLFDSLAPARPGSQGYPRRLGHPGPRSILVTHAFVAGGFGSESERPLTVGGTGTVDSGAFGGFSYVALGHLHRPQDVGANHIRYAGSLLKYSFDEASHTKTVDVVELAGDGSLTRESVALSPRRDVRRITGWFADLLRGEDAGARGGAGGRGTVAGGPGGGPGGGSGGGPGGGSGGGPTGRPDDYLLVTLLDQSPILDAMARLREVYPNILRIERAGDLPGAGGTWAADGTGPGGAVGDIRRRMTERELFGGFFADVTGEALTPEEWTALDGVLEEVRRGGPEGGRPGLEPAAPGREEVRP